MNTWKQLRHCSAYVRETDGGVYLRSYSTMVAGIVKLHGLNVNVATGEVVKCDGEKYIVLFPKFDCSMTTMQHVRKFLEDYYGKAYTIDMLRRKMLNPTDSHVIMMTLD